MVEQDLIAFITRLQTLIKDILLQFFTMKLPHNWPSSNAQYSTQYVFDSDIPDELIKTFSTKKIPQPSSTTNWAIRKISDKKHPACGQYGLFASQNLLPGTYICDYVGFISYAAKSCETSEYLISYKQGLLCDAEKIGSEGRMVNDYRGISDKPNVTFKNYVTENEELRIGIYTGKRPVKKGEEFLIEYGGGFKL